MFYLALAVPTLQRHPCYRELPSARAPRRSTTPRSRAPAQLQMMRELQIQAADEFCGSTTSKQMSAGPLTYASLRALGQQGWVSALVLSVVANGRRISRVLVACGLVYFLGRLAGRLRQTTRRLLTRFGERVLEAGV